ncbi:hypothetical protein [Pseudochelatococcus contaminans]|jgi:hypothetical protein|nr:hypothetical protein [Pseudochelatococcus contaminans]
MSQVLYLLRPKLATEIPLKIQRQADVLHELGFARHVLMLDQEMPAGSILA